MCTPFFEKTQAINVRKKFNKGKLHAMSKTKCKCQQIVIFFHLYIGMGKNTSYLTWNKGPRHNLDLVRLDLDHDLEIGSIPADHSRPSGNLDLDWYPCPLG